MARYVRGIDEIKDFVISRVILSQDFSELNVLIFVIHCGNTLTLIAFIYKYKYKRVFSFFGKSDTRNSIGVRRLSWLTVCVDCMYAGRPCSRNCEIWIRIKEFLRKINAVTLTDRFQNTDVLSFHVTCARVLPVFRTTRVNHAGVHGCLEIW